MLQNARVKAFTIYYRFYHFTELLRENQLEDAGGGGGLNCEICKMQNISNTEKDSETNPKEINLTKPVDTGEMLTLDN